MKRTALTALLALVFAISGKAQNKQDIEYVNKIFYPATALLYSEDAAGGMKMHCTATAIEKTKTGYVFVTAAHCGAVDDETHKTVSPEKTFFYLTADESADKEFMKAEPVGAGYRHRGDDFMLFEVKTDKEFPVVTLGNDPTVLEPVVNVASPLGLGKQVFVGTVSKASLDRPIVEDDINWTNAVTLQLFGTDGGSSGSAVVCLDQKAICSFVVGSVDKTTMIAMPVSRLKAVIAGLKDGSYKYWQKDPDAKSSADAKADGPKPKN
jgi:S1-C subfamily serine protease